MRVEFPGSLGHQLAGSLDLPDGEPRAYALLAHCFTGSKDHVSSRRLARGLAARGIAVLRFDFTGLGESGGDFAESTFSSDVADVVHAAAHLREHHAAPALLVGHSLGGAAVLAAAADIPEARAVATIAAPASLEHLASLLEPARAEIEAGGADVTLAGRSFHFRPEFLKDLADQPQRERVAALGLPLLVLHSPQDEELPVAHAGELFTAASHPRSFVALDGADHLLTGDGDAGYAADVIATWASRYLGE